LNNKDGELTEEEYREVIKYGRGMLINIIIGVVAAVVIAVYMGMLKSCFGLNYPEDFPI
jgi:accessory gene regulator B